MDPLDDGTVEQTESADVEVEDNDGDEVEDDGPAANFKGRHYGFAVNHLDLSDSEDSPDVDFMILAALRSTHTRSYSDDEPSEPDDSDSDGQIPYATASDQAGKEARVGRLACSLLNQRTRAPGNTPLTNAIFDAIFPGLDSPEPRARWRKTASRDRSSERNSGDIQRTEMDLSARRIGSRLASGSSSGLSSAPPTAALDCTFMELQLDATNATSSESERNNRKTRPTELVLAKRRISSGLRTGSSSGLSSAPPTAALELTFGEFQLARSSSSDDVQPNDGDIRRTELELPRRKISSGLASGSSSDLSPPPPTAALELTFTELQLASPNKAERSNKDIQRTNLSLNERKHKGALASDSSSGLSSSPPTAALQHTFADLQLGGLEGGSGHGNYLRTRNRSSTNIPPPAISEEKTAPVQKPNLPLVFLDSCPSPPNVKSSRHIATRMINEPKHDDGRSKIHHTCQNKQTETPPPDAFPQAIFIAHHGSQSYITDAVLLPSVTDDEAKGYVDLRASVSMFNRLLSSAHSLSSGVTRAFSITTHVSSYVNTSSAEYRKLSLEKLQVAKARIEALNPETRNSKVVLPFAAVAGSSSGVVNCGSSDVVSTSGSRNNLIILDTNTHGNKSSQEPVWPLFVSSEDANASTIRPPARAERESADLDKEAAGSWDLAPITTRTGIHSGAAERTSFLASLTTHPRNISTANLTTKSSTCPQVTAGASSHQLNTKTPPASTSANPSVRVESGTPGLCKERRNSEDLYIPLRSITFTTQPTFRGESETRGLCEGTGGAEDILSRPIPGLSSRSTTRSTFHAKSETPVLYRDLYKEPGAPKDLPSSTTTTESTFHAKSEPLIVEFKGPASSIKLLPLATTTETSLGWQTRGSALPLSTSHSRKTSTTTGTTNTNTWSTIPTMSAPPPPQDNVTPSGMMALPAPSKRKGLNFAAGRKKGAPSMTADLFPATTALKPEPAPEATSAVPVAPMFAPSLETVKEPTPGPSVVVPAAPAAEQNEGLRPSSVGKEKSDEVLSSSTAEDVLVKKKAEGDVVMKDAGIGGEGSGGGVQASPRQAPSASQIKPFASGKDAVTPKKKPAAKRASPQKKGKNSPTKVNTGQGSSDAMQGVEAHLNRDIDLKQSSRLSQAAIQEEFEAKKKEIRRLQKNAADKAIREEKASMERLLKEEEERGKAAAAEKRALQLQKDNEEGAKRAADLREQAEALRKQQIAEGNLKRAEADKEAARVAAVKEADEKRKMDRLKAKKEQVKIMAQSMTPKKRSAAEAMTSGASRSESALDSSTEIDDLFNDRMIIDSSKKDNGKGKAPMNPETPVSNKKRKTENGAVDTSATMPVTPSPAGRGAGAITTSKPKKVVNLSSALTKQPEAGPSSAIIGNFNSEPVQMGVFLNALTSQTSSISDIVVESANISQNQVELLQARLDETNEALNDLRQHVDESLSNFKLDILRAIRDGFRGKSDASLDSTTRALAVQVPPAPKPAQQQLLPPQPPVKRKPGRPPKWSKPGAPANLANLSAQRIQKAIQGASGAGSSVLNSQQLSDRTVKNKKQAIATRSRYMREGHTKNNTLDGHMRRSPGQIEADVDRKMTSWWQKRNDKDAREDEAAAFAAKGNTNTTTAVQAPGGASQVDRTANMHNVLSDSDAESSISEEDPDPNEAVLSPMRDDITGTGQHIQVWERIVQFGPITEGKGEGAAPAADPNDLDALFESGFDELTSDPITRHESLATLSLPARPVLHDEQNLVHTTTLRQEANEFAICHLMNKVTPDPELDMDQHNEFMATIEPVFARRLIQVQRRAGGMIVGDGKGESGEAVTGAFVAGVDGECAEVYVTWCVVADGELEDD